MKNRLKLIVFIISFATLNIFDLKAQSQLIWEKNYGGTLEEVGNKIVQTSDGGYILAGNTYSNTLDAIGNHGVSDILIIKTDASGNIEWKKVYGGDTLDTDAQIVEIPNNGGYYLTCESYGAPSGDITGHYGATTREDIWVAKLDMTGAIVWEKNFGGDRREIVKATLVSNNGGLLVAGFTESASGSFDVTFRHGSGGSNNFDYWLLNIDNNGNKLWDSCYGGVGQDQLFDIKKSLDGGYILSGSIRFNNANPTAAQRGQITTYYPSGNNNDAWIVKIDSLGHLIWEKTIGGSGNEGGNLVSGFAITSANVVALSNGNYAVAVQSNSNNNGINNLGGYDILVALLDANGNFIWQQTFGGAGNDVPTSVFEMNNDIVVTGFTSSNQGNISDNNGLDDYWLMVINQQGILESEYNFGGLKKDICMNAKLTSDNSIVLFGLSNHASEDVSNNYGLYDYWLAKVRMCNYPLNYNVAFTPDNYNITTMPLIVNFTNQTGNLSNYNFTWHFGDGTTSNDNNPIVSHQYPNNGSFQVTLIATDTITGCSDTLHNGATIICNASGAVNCVHAVSVNNPDTIKVCAYSTISLTATISGTSNYQAIWNLNGSPVNNSNNDTISVSTAGTYTITVIDSTNSGCVVTSANAVTLVFDTLALDPPVISQLNYPDVCQPLSVNLQATVGYNSYLWSNGMAVNPITVNNSTGVYVTASNSSYCNASSDVYDIVTSNATPPSICNVTVDTLISQHNYIYWEYSNPNNYDSLLIFRLGSNGLPSQIGAVSDTTTEFIDTGINAADFSYSYGIKLKKYCSVASYPDSVGISVMSSIRQNINLMVQPSGIDDMVLLWNPYPNITEYYIYRDSSLTSNLDSDFIPIDTLLQIPNWASGYFYIDQNPNFGSASRYRIEAEANCATIISPDRAAYRNRTRSNTQGLGFVISCTYQLSDSSYTFDFTGLSHSLTVVPSAAACQWSVSDTISWLAITPDSLITDTALVTITANPCSGGISRTASVQIAGIIYQVTQTCCSVQITSGFSTVPDSVDVPYILDLSNLSVTNGNPSYLWQISDSTGATIYTGNSDTLSYPFMNAGSYLINLTTTDNCGSSTAVDSLCCSLITNVYNSEKKPQVYISPNPFNNIIYLKGQNLKFGTYHILIFNSLGQKVMQQTILINQLSFESEFNLENLPKGIYNFNFIGEQEQSNFKVIKN